MDRDLTRRDYASRVASVLELLQGEMGSHSRTNGAIEPDSVDEALWNTFVAEASLLRSLYRSRSQLLREGRCTYRD